MVIVISPRWPLKVVIVVSGQSHWNVRKSCFTIKLFIPVTMIGLQICNWHNSLTVYVYTRTHMYTNSDQCPVSPTLIRLFYVQLSKTENDSERCCSLILYKFFYIVGSKKCAYCNYFKAGMHQVFVFKAEIQYNYFPFMVSSISLESSKIRGSYVFILIHIRLVMRTIS